MPVGWKTGGTPAAAPGGRACPQGRRTSVPDTTTEEARPWYPTGRCSLQGAHQRIAGSMCVRASLLACTRHSQPIAAIRLTTRPPARLATHQLGCSALSLPRNMVPTFVACSREA